MMVMVMRSPFGRCLCGEETMSQNILRQPCRERVRACVSLSSLQLTCTRVIRMKVVCRHLNCRSCSTESFHLSSSFLPEGTSISI